MTKHKKTIICFYFVQALILFCLLRLKFCTSLCYQNSGCLSYLAPRRGWRDQLQTSSLACGCGPSGLVAKREVWNRGPRCFAEHGMFARDTSSLPGDKRLHCIAATGFAGVPALECGHGGYLNGATDHARAGFSRRLATRGG